MEDIIKKINLQLNNSNGIRLSSNDKDLINSIPYLDIFPYIYEKVWALINDKKSPDVCIICGNKVKFKSIKNGYNSYCSAKCSANSPHTVEKRKQTNLQKYGVENVFASKEVKQKIKKNNLQLYGVESHTQREEIKQKTAKTNLERYGTIAPAQNNEVLNKMKQTNLQKYSITSTYNCENAKNKRLENKWNKRLEELKDIVKFSPNQQRKKFDKKYLWQCVKCNNEFQDTLDNGKIPICRICNPIIKNNYSKIAIEWLEYIMKKDKIFIQHAENIGEFNIPNTKLKADGYCKETNTIYEFYGDIYHGNIQIISPQTECHPFSKKNS
jgi:hypothetical protein